MIRVRPLHSIRTRFVLASALIVALFSFTWGAHVIAEEKAHYLQDVVDSGRLLLTSLKGPIINTMILSDMGVVPGLLDDYVDEIVKNPNLAATYAFITDEKGKVISHNRIEYCGWYYRDPLTRRALTGDRFESAVTIDAAGRKVLDAALPLRIGGKSWGALRVGFSLAPAQQHFRITRMKTILFTILLFAGGTVIFWFIGAAMTRPLEQLTRAMALIELGALNARTLPPRRDEIGLLQETFQHMLGRLRHSEQEREKAVAQLVQREKLAVIGEIVAGVAHEINNPLAAISACIYQIEAKLPPGSGGVVEHLKGGMQRIQTIVRQLTDFSRVGSLELNYVQSDQFFSEAAAFAVMALKKHNIDLVALDECWPPVTLRIDKNKMHQVVLNLLLNATAASPEGATVDLRGTVAVGCYRLIVEDRGVGIAPEDLERIFDIFYTTKPAGLGSGIGLAVCKNIVDLHQGTIEVSSRPGETIFTVTIPLERGAAQRSRMLAPARPAAPPAEG